MATHIETSAAGDIPSMVIPPLETGDRLSRAEFERRYEAMTDLKKAELIEGVVHIPSRGMLKFSEGRSLTCGLLVAYTIASPGTHAGSNGTVRLNENNEPQPDGFLRIEAHCGGKTRVDADDFLEGAPELVVEVASSGASYDLHDKMNAYRRAGVLEYVVWRVRDEEIDWFVLREGRYENLPVDDAGVYRSAVFPGFWLDNAAARRGDATAMMATLQKGLASPEHAAFVARLQQAAAESSK